MAQAKAKANTKRRVSRASQVRKQEDDFNPSHYQIQVRGTTAEGDEVTVNIQTVDIIEALASQDAHLAHAYTYITRAGRKAKSDYVTDVTKGAWWLIRAALFRGANVSAEDVGL